jgi:hypothetical protein
VLVVGRGREVGNEIDFFERDDSVCVPRGIFEG